MEPQKNLNKNIFILIGSLSAVVLAFLFWWIYGKETGDSSHLTWVSYLPYVNCALNAITAFLLYLGVSFIRSGKRVAHQRTMILAGSVSAAFLISYLTYHHFQGDTKFVAQGVIRYVYFFILISHIALSIVQVPLILATFSFAFLKKWATHKKLARITFPIWQYVSITGVIIFIFLKLLNN